MVGLRNIVVHAYFGVDLSIIWEIITKNLPKVKPLIEKSLKKEKNEINDTEKDRFQSSRC